MSKLRVESFSISIDGFGAGPNQSLENPLGGRRARTPIPEDVRKRRRRHRNGQRLYRLTD